MPLTLEQRRENMAKARAARKPKLSTDPADIRWNEILVDASKLPEPVEIDWEAKALEPVDPLAELRMKIDILWGAHKAKLHAAQGRVVSYQCVECRATTTALHPTHRVGDATPVECPNRYSKHGGALTPMDYTP